MVLNKVEEETTEYNRIRGEETRGFGPIGHVLTFHILFREF